MRERKYPTVKLKDLGSVKTQDCTDKAVVLTTVTVICVNPQPSSDSKLLTSFSYFSDYGQ